MEGFLAQTAAALWSRYGEEVSQLALLFPNRRARLFFADALSRLTEHPIWQPRYLSIDELTGSLSGLEQGGRVRLITELYRVYAQYHAESFDKFYFWGETLLADFDTVDKYLIDADVLFANVRDLRDLQADVSYLTPEQRGVIARFWEHFGPEQGDSKHKRRFMEIWRTLGPIYRDLQSRLTELGIGYGGMIQRRAAERIAAGLADASLLPPRIVVAGFNALSACEKRLFDFLAVGADTEFFWDYDTYYLDPAQEAGLFIRENIRRYPQRSTPASSRDHFLSPKRFTAVESVSDALQCKYAALLLERLAAAGPLGKETAVVLTDENLLMPLLHALPDSVGEVNITMGYPLRSSLAYSFVERLVELQNRRRERKGGVWFYHSDVLGLLRHPYLGQALSDAARSTAEGIVRRQQIYVPQRELVGDPGLAALFRSVEGWRGLSEWLLDMLGRAAAVGGAEEEQARRSREFLAETMRQIVQLRNSLEECQVEIAPPVYASLLRRHLQSVRIPFEGEPLGGLQVMGILETRNLDFENVLILSMSDDNFPGNGAWSSSFVPYNLRAAYGMPTPEHHEGVYAYYFYRLVQRARNVWMLYCPRSDEKSTGEASRYIHQLVYESPFEVEREQVGIDVNPAPAPGLEVAKQGAVREALERFTAAQDPLPLSPTAFFRYIACPLKFYFHSVARLRPREELTEEVDAPAFGTILHRAMQTLYTPLIGNPSADAAIGALIASPQAERAVERAIAEEWLQDPSSDPAGWGGNLVLIKEIILRYIEGAILPYDAAHGGLRIEHLEHEVEAPFVFGAAGERVVFKGTADRIDRLEGGAVRVVDYKTGTPHLDFAGFEALFRGEGRERVGAVIQTLLYAMMLARAGEPAVQPALYYVRAMGREDYSPLLTQVEGEARARIRTPVERYADVAAPFEERVKEALRELFDMRLPFRQCADAAGCPWCEFHDICRRG